MKRANERTRIGKEKISQRRRRKEEIRRGRKRTIRYNHPRFVVESSINDRAKNWRLGARGDGNEGRSRIAIVDGGEEGWKLPRSPAGDLELVIKYKEACFASSRMESARVRRLFPFRLPSRLLASPFRYARNTERAVFNSRLHSIYFESRIRRCRTWSERPSDAISAIAEKSHPTSAAHFFAHRVLSKKRILSIPLDTPEI